MTIIKILFISVGIALVGCIPLMGIPGALVLYMGKPFINLIYGPLAFEAWFSGLSSSTWPLAIMVTVVWPVSIPISYLIAYKLSSGAVFFSTKPLLLFIGLVASCLVLLSVLTISTTNVKRLDDQELVQTSIRVGNVSQFKKFYDDANEEFYTDDPLKAAIFSGNLPISKYIISKRKNVDKYLNQKSPENSDSIQFASPLHTAVNIGSVEITEVLLEKGANPNLANSMGQTPVYALNWDPDGNADILRALLKYGADFSAVDVRGNSPIIQLTQNTYNSWPQMIDYIQALVDGGANPNVVNVEGKSALDYAVENHHSEAVELLKSLKK